MKSTFFDFKTFRKIRDVTKHVLEQEATVIVPNAGANEGKMYGPVLPQALEVDCEEFRDVLDPMTVPAEGPEEKVEVKFR